MKPDNYRLWLTFEQEGRRERVDLCIDQWTSQALGVTQ